MAITIIEQHAVAPPPGEEAEQTLPLLHFDMIWLPFHLMQNLFFYDFPCSESHFSDTIVPNLKKSLSLTLKHFPPLAGSIIFPLTSSNTPFSHVSGDAISLTIAVSEANLIPLTGNHSRDADHFHDFVPELPPAAHSAEQIKFAVAAVQVTLFPNQGICVGFTNHQAIGDGTSTVGFLQTWASITKFNGDDHIIALGTKISPVYERRNIVPNSDMLAKACWEVMKTYNPVVSSSVSPPTYKVRGTFILSEGEIGKLKNFVLSKKKSMAVVSSFAVISAYVWTCLAKSAGDEVADDEPEYFTCTANIRRRLNPPLPEYYFGNCLGLVQAESTHGRLKEDEGIVFAAEAIMEAIEKTVNDENGMLDGFIGRSLERRKLSGKRVLGITGSPRFDLYGADFGWGRVNKFEAVHIDDCGGSVSICKSREFEGGVEIGLSTTKAEMAAFEAIFNHRFKEAM